MAKKKTLFIDGQVFQSAAWDRGMGKYSLALLKAMFAKKSQPFDNVVIIFTEAMSLDPEAKKMIKTAVPRAKHVLADLQVPFDSSLANIPALQEKNQRVLDQLIAEHTDPEAPFTFLLLSLFIDQVCSVFPTSGQKVLLFYDLIPLQYNERYGLLTSYDNYLARYKTIFEADDILTISQTVADDVALNLGISATKLHNIDGAPIEREAKLAAKPDIRLPNQYVLMPSGNDIRKNNIHAVQAFEIYLQEKINQDTALVITSTFDQDSREALQAYSKNIIFTGNVSEAELAWLYRHAEALLFVSEYEGLGLPILEAAEMDKPIVCSNLTVFNEMSPTAFYYSDPADPFSIADALLKAMARADFVDKHKDYPGILKKYTWENTADKALKAIGKTVNDKPEKITKKRIAVLTPSPDGYSAIGKLVMQLHPAMQDYFDIDYFVEHGRTHKKLTRPSYLEHIANVFPAQDFNMKRYADYDAVIYHIGNSEFHMDTIKSALYLPGYAIFHDTHLTDIFKGELLTHGYVAQNRLDAEELLDEKIGNSRASYASSIINNQLALVAHSSYTQKSLQKTCLHAPDNAVKINLPTATPAQTAMSRQSELTIGLAGIIHPAKGLDIIESVAQESAFYKCKIHIFGLSLVSSEVIQRLRSYPNVTVDTDLTDFQFQTMLSKLDVLINFRPEYKGETSLATIEAMRFGVVPVVRKIGWYDDLPNDAAVKVNDQEALLAELEALVGDPERLLTMKKAARAYVRDHHNYETYARSLYELLSNREPQTDLDKAAIALREGASLQEIQKLI